MRKLVAASTGSELLFLNLNTAVKNLVTRPINLEKLEKLLIFTRGSLLTGNITGETKSPFTEIGRGVESESRSRGVSYFWPESESELESESESVKI